MISDFSLNRQFFAPKINFARPLRYFLHGIHSFSIRPNPLDISPAKFAELIPFVPPLNFCRGAPHEDFSFFLYISVVKQICTWGAPRQKFRRGTKGISSANLAGEISRAFGLIENEWISCKKYHRGRVKFIFWSEKQAIKQKITNLKRKL